MTKRDQQPSELNVLRAKASLESSLSFPNGYEAGTTVNITNTNITYGGDNYSGNINDGFAGGRHNRNSSTSCQLHCHVLVVYRLNALHRQPYIITLDERSDAHDWGGRRNSAVDASPTLAPWVSW